MKPSALIVMSVGLIVAIAGFFLCLFAQNNAKKNYPNEDLFSTGGENYRMIDGDSVRSLDFSDEIVVVKNDEKTSVKQDIKVVSLDLHDIPNVEIVGRSSTSEAVVYNMTPGLYACTISSGVITVSNTFTEAFALDYLSDAFSNFNGIRRFFNPEVFSKRPKKVVITINDKDELNRIEMNLTNCKNVTVKNLTCSLDCKIVLNNSNISFDSCTFKEREIIYPDPDPNNVDAEGNPIVPDPIVINHFFTMDLTMKNGSTFTARNSSFSSFEALINKKLITEKDVNAENSQYTADQIGTYVSSGGSKCTLTIDLTTSAELYGFYIKNVPDADKITDTSLVTIVNGFSQPQIFSENSDNEAYPQIKVNASNCEIDVLS